MAVTAHFFPKLNQNHMRWSSAAQSATPYAVDLTTGASGQALKVGLVASGTFNWVAATEQYEFVSDFLANSGAGGGGALTEVAGGGYSRQALTSVTQTSAGNVNTLTCANPSWAAATFTANYAFFYDDTGGTGSDTHRPLICYWDLGGAQSVASGTFTLTIAGGGLVTWTAS